MDISIPAPRSDDGPRGRGRPSKAADSAHARLIGPPCEQLSIPHLKTRNLEIFIIPTGVCQPLTEDVIRFADRIKFSDDLLWHPIRVTPNMEVYDGKLRLAAAKLLGCEISYFIDVNLTVGHIIRDRGQPRGWSLTEYCKYYSKQGRPYYQHLLEFGQTHALPLTAAAGLLHANGLLPIDKVILEFQNGQLQINDEQHALQIIALRDEFQRRQLRPSDPKRKKISGQHVFLTSLSQIVALAGSELGVLRAILPAIHFQSTHEDYLRHISRLIRDEIRRRGAR